MADIEARVNENSPIGFFTWCWTIVVEITDGRIGDVSGHSRSEEPGTYTRIRNDRPMTDVQKI